MKLTAQLDVDVIALQQDDEVACLIALDAPVPVDTPDQPGQAVIFVVDRSGSMAGGPIQAVQASLHSIADRMRPQDSFGVIAFDHTARIAVPVRPMREHDRSVLHELINGIQPRGNTDLSAGYLLGLTEARRCAGKTGASVLLLSDGHANAGIVDPGQLGSMAAQAAQDRVTTATIGLGHGYDETLLAEMATQGRGAHRFAATPDDAMGIVAEEAGDLLRKAVLNAFLRIRPASQELLSRIVIHHDAASWTASDPDGAEVIVVPLGDFYSGEHRELLVTFTVPALSSVGPTHLATLGFEYVALPDLTAERVSWPIGINVVPGDEASRRIPNPAVTTARLLIEATNAKKAAVDALRNGDDETASALMEAQALCMDEALAAFDESDPTTASVRERLREEGEQARKLARAARERDMMLSVKSFAEDIQMEATGRNDQIRRQRTRNRRDY